MGWGYYEYPPYVSVGERRRKAQREIAALRKQGKELSPVALEGNTIAKSFWGKAWCKNLERYSDFENRLPRGRTYVRTGSVLDLAVAKGRVDALVLGTELYTVRVKVTPVDPARWKAIVGECAGKIDSVIELLRGKLSGAVMEVITREGTGLFPAPKEIHFSCSCPDDASLCKHVAAALYGAGARLDHAPELIFVLRGVDAEELVTHAAAGAITGKRAIAKEKVLEGDLASVFGIDLDMGEAPEPAKQAKPKRAAGRKPARAKPAPPPPATITGAELSAIGVPPPTVQSWRKTGVLTQTGERGVYGRTPRLEERLARYRR